MKFIFIRHGETNANVEQLIYGVTHSDFTKNGLDQIDRILDYIKLKEIDYFYSSPLERTKIIADKIGECIGKKAVPTEEVREMNYGIFEGMTSNSALEKYPEEYNSFMSDYGFIIPEGENVLDFDKRVISFLDKIKNDNGTSVIVTHGGVIRTAIMYLLNLHSEDRWHFKILPGMIIEIEYKNGYGVLVQMQQLAHPKLNK
ncbi:histidine phosphatase family protein [Vallitalea sp.]|jgi:broad specificity phosphatase PhoE|uniref:histidine phosphatase family protein n=1 Tax=Vallitalea sp. TaxID=1882829 RepID=UPI0025D0F956|nr:histidine phosphatase family protein [Vallitalea sp.]MCT4688888.1 histidine phosphatase family protein [Vallitalea sp.]